MRNPNYFKSEITRNAEKMSEDQRYDLLQIMIFMLWRSGKTSDNPYFTARNIFIGGLKYYAAKARAAAVIIADALHL